MVTTRIPLPLIDEATVLLGIPLGSAAVLLGALALAVTLYMHRTPHVWLGVGVIGIVTGVLLARYEDDPGWVWALVLARYLLAPRRFIAPLILDDEVSLHAYVHDPALSHSGDWWWPLPARSRSLSGGGYSDHHAVQQPLTMLMTLRRNG